MAEAASGAGVVLPFVPEAVVFDLDGLLVDSEDAWGRAERRVVEEFGHPWDPAVRTALLGRGPDEASLVLATFLGDPERAPEVDRRLLAAARDEFARDLHPRPGARELVEALRGRVALGVATNSRRALAERALRGSGLEGLVATVVCAEDVAAPKPAPDPYATACARLRADPARVVAFEDSPIGVASARGAGLWTVGCPSMPGQTLDGADVVIASLRDVDADTLLGAVSGNGGRGAAGRGAGATTRGRPAR